MPVRGAAQADFKQWPNVTTTADLPNVSGSPTQNANLQTGELCANTNSGILYVCQIPTPGSAFWVPVSYALDPILTKWNGGSTAQFTSPQNIGAPVNPAMTFVSLPNEATNVLECFLDTATPAGAGFVCWANDVVDTQPFDIAFAVSFDPAAIPTDAVSLGVVFSGDAGPSTYLVCTLETAPGVNDGVIAISNGSAARAKVQTIGLSGAPTLWRVRASFNCRTVDQATFTPYGVPAIQGKVTFTPTAATHVEEFVAIDSGSGFTPPDWGGAAVNRVGIEFLAVGAPIADPGGARMRIWDFTFSRNLIGTP